MNTDLVSTLNAVGKSTEIFESPDGSQVLMLPYGGRVLGLFSKGSNENFYWTNTALNSVESAKEFYGSDVWQNSGGDRTWLSPEVDLFFPDFPSMEKYFQPRSLDPGKYEVVKEDGKIRLVNRLSVTVYRSKEVVDLEISKFVAPAPNPLRYEKGLKLDGVEYAGYTQNTSLSMTGKGKDTTAIGLWNLVQMPHGGDLLVPTFARTEAKIYFGDISSDDLISTDNMVRYKMRSEGEHKIGIRAVATTGRVGYMYEKGGKWALIVRNYVVNPSGEYIDVPWADQDDFGYSTQACNVKSHLGCFSELEYHIPAIGKGTGRTRCDDAAQVWAFRGTKEQIQTIAHTLLSAEA